MNKAQAKELWKLPNIPVGRSDEARHTAMRPFLNAQQVNLNELVDLLPFAEWAQVDGTDHLRIALIMAPESVKFLILTSQEGGLEIFGPGEICYRFTDLAQRG